MQVSVKQAIYIMKFDQSLLTLQAANSFRTSDFLEFSSDNIVAGEAVHGVAHNIT